MSRLETNKSYNMKIALGEPTRGLYLGNGGNGLHQVLVGIENEDGELKDPRMYVFKDYTIREDGLVEIKNPTLLERLKGPEKEFAEEVLSRGCA